MAEFDSSFYTIGTYDDGTGIFSPTADSVAEAHHATDNEGSGQPGETTFEPGDNMTITGGSHSGGGQYVGSHDDGFLVEQGGNFYFFSNTEYSNGESIDIDTDPFAVCFLPGTLISTPDGERSVEALVIGDLVKTADGQTVPVKWLGRQTISTMFGMPEGRRPVCIAAGALGDGLPRRDLRVTSDHALLIDGVLVHAGALGNGTTVRRIPAAELGDRFVVYHIETENHELVLAEGAAAETFIDNVSRRRFDNHAEYEALYGSEAATLEQLQQPRAMSSRQVPQAIRARIATAASARASHSHKAA